MACNFATHNTTSPVLTSVGVPRCPRAPAPAVLPAPVAAIPAAWWVAAMTELRHKNGCSGLWLSVTQMTFMF